MSTSTDNHATNNMNHVTCHVLLMLIFGNFSYKTDQIFIRLLQADLRLDTKESHHFYNLKILILYL